MEESALLCRKNIIVKIAEHLFINYMWLLLAMSKVMSVFYTDMYVDIKKIVYDES